MLSLSERVKSIWYRCVYSKKFQGMHLQSLKRIWEMCALTSNPNNLQLQIQNTFPIFVDLPYWAQVYEEPPCSLEYRPHLQRWAALEETTLFLETTISGYVFVQHFSSCHRRHNTNCKCCSSSTITLSQRCSCRYQCPPKALDCVNKHWLWRELTVNCQHQFG